MIPWLGAAGTHPSPPPPPSPPDRTMLAVAWVYFLIALLIFLFVTVCIYYRTRGSYVAYWCCCFLPCLRGNQKNWDDGGDGGVGMWKTQPTGVALPAVMIN